MDYPVYVGNLILRRNTDFFLGIAVLSSFGYLFCMLYHESNQYEEVLEWYYICLSFQVVMEVDR